VRELFDLPAPGADATPLEPIDETSEP